jgi:hypothetical protein
MKLKKIVSIWGLCFFAVSANADVFIEGIGSFSKIQKANILAIVNSYIGLTNMGVLPGANKDASLFKNLPNTIVVQDADASKLEATIGLFAMSDCQERKESRIVHFSGHGYTYIVRPNSAMYRYSFLGNQQFDEKTKNGAYDIDSLLVKLSSSNCKYVLVVDAVPPTFVQKLPRNVTAVWAAALGGYAMDTPDGGVLTLAFNKALSTSKSWTANTLTAFLRANTPELSGLYSKPWVQSHSPDDYIYFPKEDTSSPEFRLSQVPQFQNDEITKSKLDGVKTIINEESIKIMNDALKSVFTFTPK